MLRAHLLQQLLTRGFSGEMFCPARMGIQLSLWHERDRYLRPAAHHRETSAIFTHAFAAWRTRQPCRATWYRSHSVPARCMELIAWARSGIFTIQPPP